MLRFVNFKRGFDPSGLGELQFFDDKGYLDYLFEDDLDIDVDFEDQTLEEYLKSVKDSKGE